MHNSFSLLKIKEPPYGQLLIGLSAGRRSFRKQLVEKPACHVQNIPTVSLHIGGIFKITAVRCAKELVYILTDSIFRTLFLAQAGEKMLLQLILICSVSSYGLSKAVIVNIGESVGCVVYKLSHIVVVPKIPVLFIFECIDVTLYPAVGVLIVMTVEPAGAYGAFKIREEVAVGLNTADKKCSYLTAFG